jgi:hypothetical protein
MLSIGTGRLTPPNPRPIVELMARTLYRTLRARFVACDEDSGRVTFAREPDGTGAKLTIEPALPGSIGPALTDHDGKRAGDAPIQSWLASPRSVSVRMSTQAATALGYEAMSAHIDDVAMDLGPVVAGLRRLLGPDASESLRAVVSDVFHMRSRRWPVVTCRLVQGEVVLDQKVAISWSDGRSAAGRVVGLEMHAPPGMVGLMVSVDGPHVLEPGATIVNQLGQSVDRDP